ncbi:SPOR domain-containing protein [Photobacterium leiognathi]|uniref:SPOR domain-containing protein n=1 Tax=Photobacterium leiognathi TaxID=553611 RepID=UPI0002088D68|nr:SPOR domain-containing protein [Photobacterium leiognathi]PSW52592.1 cell division protein [Photobacterium leiognathi subsp. mandapamensis]GAA05246.1 sporulation related domain protein [Photobacterium leiognathi subsp. mandapamensis svers.1.1.]
MATKDYVKRGRSPKPANKKSSPSRKKAPAPSGFPTKWAVTAVVLVFGLISGLFFLSGTDVPEKPAPKDDIPTIVKPQPVDEVKKPVQKEVLPPKPEEKWRYINELENKKVIVPDDLENQRVQPVKKEPEHKPTPTKKTESAQKPAEKVVEKKPAEKKAEPASTVRYVLQCGAYRKKSQADERKAQIAFQGLNSQLKVSNDAKGTWYRVVLGPYSQKSSAEKDKAKLQSSGVSPCGIWHWE